MQSKSPPFPWRPLTALLLALAAQTLLEPPAHVPAAIGLYVIAIIFLLWSLRRGEWTLPASPTPSSVPQFPVIHYHSLPLLTSIVLLAIAFFLFGDNQFTVINLSLWLVGIVFFLRAVWQRKTLYTDDTDYTESHGFSLPKKIREISFIREIRVPHLLFLSILLIAAFFRFHHLAQVPAEPFSDHAEKILDVYDITQGETRIFFPRNTGREAIQFYWTLFVAAIFQTGLTFQSLKIGTALLGFLTLPFIYQLGKEIANRRAGLLAMLFAGVAYWPNVISRVGLRFSLYPLFVAPTFYFLLRGLRTRNRNDFILSGIFLGLGLHGYTPFRIVPLLVLVTVLLYISTQVDRYTRKQVVLNSGILAGSALVVFLPLLRYALTNPDQFWFRASSRALAANSIPIFISNLWNALLMFNVNDGNIFVNSIAHRPALDVVTGALFVIGLILILTRRNFSDLWLVAAILTLILPSVFSLAFPDENPALNRAGGALVPVFVLVGMTLDGLLTRLSVGLTRSGERVIAAGVVGILFAASAIQNYDLVFRQYDEQYQRVVWRTSEMGAVIEEFGHPDRVWIVPYEQWVDTRLPGLWAGIPNRDFGLPRERLVDTLQLPAPKLFIFKASPKADAFDDAATLEVLRELYPQGELSLHESEPWWQSFWVYFVPVQ
ncbi:MAG: ArnT family glycosyltransferase [Chloroflexota bacterium]